MGLPNINIAFSTAAVSAIKLSAKGIVAIIIKDAAAAGGHVLTDATQIPVTLGVENKAYIARAFTGYVNTPRKVIVFVEGTAETDLTEGLAFMALQKFDYLVGPPDCTADEAAAIASWTESQRTNNLIFKAVLPNLAADSEGIVNFTSDENKIGDVTYTAAQYCSRIAGLIAGTPMTISCTYATLPELTDVKRMTNTDMDAAIDAGKFILLYDGEKVKTGRGVNSLQTTTADKGDAYKKIKIVEAIDMMQSDIRMTMQDSYIGKYSNSYDHKCLLITALKGYFAQVAIAGIIKSDYTVDINIDKQKAYLTSVGIDVTKLTDQEIREADTGTHVFLVSTVHILDAIEDIDLAVNI